jgi:hypothetical protein
MNNPDHIFRNLETIFWGFLGLKCLDSLMRIRDPGWKGVGSGIRDGRRGSATLLAPVTAPVPVPAPYLDSFQKNFGKKSCVFT